MKEVEFLGTSLNVIREFPAMAKREAGYQVDWKPMSTIGQGVREIRIRHKGQYRVIYIAIFKDTVYVLHAFQKKSQKTSKLDLEAAKRTLKEVLARQQP